MPPGEKKTFEELQAATGISVGSLHAHLKELSRGGFIDKTEERPARYSRSGFYEMLVRLAEIGIPAKPKLPD